VDGHSQEQQRHRQAPIDIERRDMVVDILFQREDEPFQVKIL